MTELRRTPGLFVSLAQPHSPRRPGARRPSRGALGCPYGGDVVSSPSSIWPILHYADTRTAVGFLVEVVGMAPAVVAEDDDGDIVHAELRWPGGGAIVVGATKHTDSVHGAMPAGANALYLVVADVDAVHARVVEAGAEVVEAPHDTVFGSGARSRVMTIRDTEGNLWTFGDYGGAVVDEP